MIKKSLALSFFLFLTAAAMVCFADEEAGNRAYVQASDYGLFYGKSVPSESYGLAGKTQIFQVTPQEDKLLFTYNWYSPEIFIYGYTAGPVVYVVQFGAWDRGHLANDKDLAVAFYKNDQLLKKYSTLDIVKDEKNVSASVSHYTIFNKKIGFRRPWGNQIVFDVELSNGQTLTFDTDTGEIISKEEEKLNEQLYLTRSKIEQLKWQWYEANKDKIKDINNSDITEDDLKAIAPGNYPAAPDGYKIIPHKMWIQTEITKQ